VAISQKLLNDGESVILGMRQHPKALFLPLLALVALLAFAVVVQRLVDQEIVTLVAWVIAGVGILWYVVRPFLLWLTAVHAITDRRLITRWGIITRRGHDIPLHRISDVSLEINLIDRPFGCGTLIITNASTNGHVHLHDIPRVEKTKLLLHNLINGTQEPSRRADEGI